MDCKLLVINKLNSNFEAKYINITWADKNSALSVRESTDVIPLDVIDTENSHLEAITYSKINKNELGQIAFRILDDKNHTPYFENNKSEKIKLRSLKDNLTGKIWWIEGEKWSATSNRWQSSIFRSAGEVILRIGVMKCKVHISSLSFSYEDLELYLQDFRNDFWYLILHEDGYIQGEAKSINKILDIPSIELIDKFIEYATKVIKNPKKELREIQSLKISKKVRPIPRTFMEIATKGHQKFLTSRGYKDSYSISENKYICYIVDRVHLLLNNLIKITTYVSENEKTQLRNYQNRLDNILDIKHIDKETIENEIKELEEQLEREKEETIEKEKSFKKSLDNQRKDLDNPTHPKNKYKFVKRIILLTKETIHEGIYFAKSRKTDADDWSEPTDFYFWFSFDTNLLEDKLELLKEYEISGYIDKWWKKVTGKKDCARIDFKYIEDIKLVDYKKIERKLNDTNLDIIKLEKNDWKRELTVNEKNEQRFERESIKKSIHLLEEKNEHNESLSVKFKPLLPKLTLLKNEFVQLNIKKDSFFPNSMVFIQNPNYQGAHKFYKKIINLSGLNDKLFLGLQEIEKIGILNIALIYERWCLLQIIKILIDTYHYSPEKDWKTKLINQTLNSKNNRKIEFENKEVCRKLTLWYEKEIPNGKRPDFLLDVQSTIETDETVAVSRFADPDEEDTDHLVHRLVMDAKFYEDINEKHYGGISNVIDALYNEGKNKKDYSENKKNSVFILQPSKNAVPEKKTPQEWARNSYYGETQMFDWDKNPAAHKYGSILLSPMEKKRNPLDDLHRLIGMFLQYGMLNNFNAAKDKEGKEKLFCVVCGSDKQRPLVGKYMNSFSCEQCKHVTTYNFCWKCKFRIIKNGDYWTYHATRAQEIYNIKCPLCATLI